MYASKMRAAHAAVFATAASLSLIAAATPAAAADTAGNLNATPVQVVVNYGDLDLTHSDGVDRLNTRVRNAAKQACGVGSSRDLAQMSFANACRKTALAKARQDVQVAIAEQKGGAQLASRDTDKRIGVGAR